MGTSEKFCLRWNDFESNISGAFRELREEKDFFDITLACDDNQIQAHKVILSACSQFFRNILRRNPHQHPLLYLKGVKYSELMSVLNFMYHGEVNVAQEELNSFLSVAEDLRVKGLTQNNSESLNNQRKESIIGRTPTEKEAPKRQRPIPAPNVNSNRSQAPKASTFLNQDDDDIQEVVPVKSEPKENMPLQQYNTGEENQDAYNTGVQSNMADEHHGSVALEDGYPEESFDYGQYEGYDLMGSNADFASEADSNKGLLDATILSKMEECHDAMNLKVWRCTECGHQSRKKSNICQHVERKHMNLTYNCSFCPAILSSRYELNAHNLRKHM